MKKVVVIGSGFSGLSAACFLAREGYEVTVFEKNESPGGRARKFQKEGFVFDMGPSWYWMPDVFEKFFHEFGKTASDFYQLERLDPSYRIYFGKDDMLDIPAGVAALTTLFDKIEPGSGEFLHQFLAEARLKYEIGMHRLVYKPGLSVAELMDPYILKNLFHLRILQSIASYIRKFFKDKRLISLLEFPVLFLGARPEKTPALYSLMNYADMALGSWYPRGGMYKVVDAMVQLAESLGVKFRYNAPVTSIELNGSRSTGVNGPGFSYPCDFIVASADYHHVEQQLLPKQFRKYSASYWQRRVLAPSSLIFYLGVSKKIKHLLHHNLFFDEDFGPHAHEIYDDPKWPSLPQFYLSCPSKTDPSVAPGGCENLMVLIPVAPDLDDGNEIRDKYFHAVMRRIEKITGESVLTNIVYCRSYAHNDFVADYNSFKGNAYGLANTLFQTANFKPSILNKKISNLFYTGQLTVPGPGVPPSIISGQVVARELTKRDKRNSKVSYL